MMDHRLRPGTSSSHATDYEQSAGPDDATSLLVPTTPLKPVELADSPDARHGRGGAYDEDEEGTTQRSGALKSNLPSMMMMGVVGKREGAHLTGSATASAVGIYSQCPQVTIQNIVATCNLGIPLDLKCLAMHARNAEYNPKRFAAVIMRIREPRTTALIFSSGKMVVTGGRSEELSRLAARKHARIVQKIGAGLSPEGVVRFLDYKVQNMVGSADMKFAIHLEALFITHVQFCSYEPELFPGLIYRMVVPRVVILIFVSGKLVITGAKRREDVEEALQQIYPIVRGFKK